MRCSKTPFRAMALFFLIVGVGAGASIVACSSGDDNGSTGGDGGTQGGGDATAQADDAGGGANDGGSGEASGDSVACDDGTVVPVTPGLATLFTIVGSWHEVSFRFADGKDVAPEKCDDEIAYRIDPVAASPSWDPDAGPYDNAAIRKSACVVAHGDYLPIKGGRISNGEVGCSGPNGCFNSTSTLRMLWEPDVQTGLVYVFDANGKRGSLLAHVRPENGKLLYEETGGTRVLDHAAGAPACH